MLYILDGMIEYSDEFRYEHCSGGSLKDFSTLERMTFMTTEDSASPMFHRMSLYANTYMINPIQLKGDVSASQTVTASGKVIIGYASDNITPLLGHTNIEYVKYVWRSAMLGAMMAASSPVPYTSVPGMLDTV